MLLFIFTLLFLSTCVGVTPFQEKCTEVMEDYVDNRRNGQTFLDQVLVAADWYEQAYPERESDVAVYRMLIMRLENDAPADFFDFLSTRINTLMGDKITSENLHELNIFQGFAKYLMEKPQKIVCGRTFGMNIGEKRCSFVFVDQVAELQEGEIAELDEIVEPYLETRFRASEIISRLNQYNDLHKDSTIIQECAVLLNKLERKGSKEIAMSLERSRTSNFIGLSEETAWVEMELIRVLHNEKMAAGKPYYNPSLYWKAWWNNFQKSVYVSSCVLVVTCVWFIYQKFADKRALRQRNRNEFRKVKN
eukprot:TRINITY_DN166593_c0_g1_i1.p1 TRINITY_DN166593_c0_g1~~TRINITY_DN166593_c0_g1_i1.p1  ORF type:complete len:306 (-),score=46.51 TRINITY_DN166593_c0_g1_i1:385-1302(-)